MAPDPRSAMHQPAPTKTDASPSKPRKRSWKRRLARLTALALVLAVCLLVLEFATRIVYNRDGMHFGIEMWKYARDVKRPSTNAEMGHEHRPDVEAFLMGVPVKINALGLRERAIRAAKDADTYRVLVLGDSMTFGWGAPQEKTYSRILETLWSEKPPAGKKRVEVINAGVGNYNTAQEVAYFKAHGADLQPDLVLLGFFINDAEPTPKQAESWLARNSCFYTSLASGWDNLCRKLDWRPSYKDYYLGLYEDGRDGWEACKLALGELADLCKERGIKLHVAIIPELHTLGEKYEFHKVHDAVKAVARRHGVPVTDLLDAFPPEAPETYWVSPGDAHPNEKGHRLIAEKLASVLMAP